MARQWGEGQEYRLHASLLMCNTDYLTRMWIVFWGACPPCSSPSSCNRLYWQDHNGIRAIWKSHAEWVRVVPGTVLFPHTLSLISWIMWQLPPNDWMRIKGMGEVSIQQRLLSKTCSRDIPSTRVSGTLPKNIPTATNTHTHNLKIDIPCRLVRNASHLSLKKEQFLEVCLFPDAPD